MLRALARLTRRARLPLRYSQGYNPHALLSLPAPRPVGVTSRDELLVADLAADTPPERTVEMLDGMQGTSLHGLTFLSGGPLPGRRAPRLARVEYELPLAPGEAKAVRERLEALRARDHWPVQRPARRGRRPRTLDLRESIERIELESDSLRWSQASRDGASPRPAEVLRLLELDDRQDLARVVRTEADYGPDTNRAVRAHLNRTRTPCQGKC